MNRQQEWGCLLVDDPLCGQSQLISLQKALSDQGGKVDCFTPQGHESFYEQLQRSYQQIRRDEAVNGILGRGLGCDCALALAGQLPTDRLILLEPLEWHGSGFEFLRRIQSYARRGAAFCIADVLVIPGPRTSFSLIRWFQRCLSNSRLTIAEPSQPGKTKREEIIKIAILHYLRHGVLPKSLAENAEMCIIYA